jgi:hypothetical protein
VGADFIMSYEYSFFARMGYPDVRWSVFSSYFYNHLIYF